MNTYLSRLTIVTPTYNRPGYLKRALEYWNSVGISLIVVDGSHHQYLGDIPPNTAYYHCPKSSVGSRWSSALKHVKTPYVALCADDDFLVPSGLETCLSHLEAYSELASVQGLSVSFEIFNRKCISVELSNPQMIGHHLSDLTAYSRLDKLFDNYIHQIYAVHRTLLLQQAFNACADQTNPNYIELAAAIIPTIHGCHKVLPVLYSARQIIADSSSGSFEVPRTDILNPESHKRFATWKDNISKIYANTQGLSLEESTSVINRIIQKYFQWDLRSFPTRQSEKPSSLSSYLTSIKSFLRSLVPASLILLKRRFSKVNSASISQSYPHCDLLAASEWKKLEQFISSFNYL